MNLRFVMRDGQRILQMCADSAPHHWFDVPLCVDEKDDARHTYPSVGGELIEMTEAEIADSRVGELTKVSPILDLTTNDDVKGQP